MRGRCWARYPTCLRSRRGKELDARTDVYSFGAVLYEMATGALPFAGESTGELLEAIFSQEPVAPVRLNARVPAELERIIAKAMEKDRTLRYQSASEMRADLQRLHRDTMVGRVTTERREEVAVTPNRPSRRRWWIGTGAAALVLAVAVGIWLGREVRRGGSQAQTPDTAATSSIAVLPFVDLSPGKDQEYFADGLAEELLNELAKVPELRVAARSSCFQFKGKAADMASIGEQLKVGAILEGSVRKAGSRVRISVQLVKVADGFQLWSDTYDHELTDIFEVQDEIARSVASALKVRLQGMAASSAARGGNAEAYNLYLQGEYFLDRRSREDGEKAISCYEQALKLSPGYARAWAGLARAHYRRADLGYVPVEEGYPNARQAAEKALELDPSLAEAHAALGKVRRSYDWDWSGADAAFKRALELEPGNARVLLEAAMLARTLGRFEEAVRLSRRATELDPLSVQTLHYFGINAIYAERLEEAEAAFRKVLEFNPGHLSEHMLIGRIHLMRSKPEAALGEMEREEDPLWRCFGLALVYHSLGRKKEADAALAEFLVRGSEYSAYQAAEIYAFRGEADESFAWLERAYAQRDVGLALMKGDPLLENIEGDPRYPVFLKKMRLPL